MDKAKASVQAKASTKNKAQGSNRVQLSFEAPGLSAPEVEELVSMAATRSILSLPGVESVESVSRDSRALLHVDFAKGRDIWADRKLLSGLDWTSMPDAVVPSLLPNMDPGLLLRYELSSDSLDSMALRSFQDNEMRLAVLRVPGVAVLATCGGSLAELQVELDPQRSAAFGIDVDTVADVLRSPAAYAAGPIVAKSMETLGEVVLLVKEDRPVYLRDVATIRHGPATPTCLATRSGNPVVSVEVFAAAGSERASVIAALREVLKPSEQSLGERGISMSWPPAPALRVRLRVPPSQVLGSSLESIDQVARKAASQIAPLPGVSSIGVQIGIPEEGIFDGTPNEAEIQVAVRATTDVAALANRIASAVQGPGVQPLVEALDSDGRPSASGWARIYGPDHDSLREIASQVAGKLAAARGVDNVVPMDTEQKPTLAMTIDRVAAARLGISASVLAHTLLAATEGLVIGPTQPEGDAIRLRLGNHLSPEELSALPIVSPGGAALPLGQLVSIELRSEAAAIRSKNARRYVEVRFQETEAHSETQATVTAAVVLPAGYELEWGAGAH